MRIEAVRQVFTSLPIKPQMLAHLRKTARLFSTHYSTIIEGNRLTQDQVAKVIEKDQHFPGRERDQSEVKGYYAALDELERIAKRAVPLPKRSFKRFMRSLLEVERRGSSKLLTATGRTLSVTAVHKALFTCHQRPKTFPN